MTSPQTLAPASEAQAAQAGLALTVAGEARLAAAGFNPADIAASKPRLVILLANLAHRNGLASGTLAARFYQAQRSAAGVLGRYTVRPASPAGVRQVAATVDWVTQPLYGATPDMAAFEKRVVGAAEKLVLDVGRETIIRNSVEDRKAKGWARIPEHDACYFCALLATRGAVYKQDTVGFRSHDHCRCHAEPVFTAYEPTAEIRRWEQMYHEHGRGTGDPINGFRRAYENRLPKSS